MAIRLRSLAHTAGVYFFLTLYGCFAIGSRTEGVVIDDDDFFKPDSLAKSPAEQIVFRQLGEDVRLQIVARWDDLAGLRYYPSVHVACRAWNDDTVTAWQQLTIDDFVVSGDTVVIHTDKISIIDAQLGGVNFSFRIRFSSAGIQTEWVRLPESIRFYDRRRKGIPRQPAALRLLP